MDLFTRLRSISFRNFRCFREEQRVEFPPQGLYLIRGENEDTSGSSGAGKTSFVKAIAYAAGYESQPASKLKCWTADGPMAVEMTVGTKDSTATVKRGTKLSVTRNGEVDKGPNDVLEFYWQDALGGCPPDVLAAVTYRAQKKPGLFLSRPDGERKSFLATLLGLVSLEDAIERSNKRATELEIEQRGYQGALDHNLASLAARQDHYPVVDVSDLQDAVDALTADLASSTEMQKQGVEHLALLRGVLKDELAKAEAETAAAVAAIKRERAQVGAARLPFEVDNEAEKEILALIERGNEGLRTLREAARAAEAEQRTRVSAAQRVIAEGEAALKDLPRVEREQDRIAAESRKIRDDALCPTCERKWEYGPAKTLLDKLDEDFRANEKILFQLRRVEEELPGARAKLSAAQTPLVADPAIAQFQEALAELQQRLGTARAAARSAKELYESAVRLEDVQFEQRISAARAADRSKTLSAQAAPVIEEHEKFVSTWRATADSVRMKLTARQRGLAEQITKNAVNAALEEKRVAEVARDTEAVARNRADVARATEQIAAERDFAAMVKSFFTAFFNEVVDEIAVETNAILARVPNVAHITLRFEEKVTARGTQIGTIVLINGDEKSLADLSGGMDTAVDLAVDLAVSAVVSRRTGGNMPGWLVLDEPFTGLDNVCKEACMEILKDAARERLILVVDHATEFKEMFSQFVTISYKNGAANVTEAT